MVFYLFFIFLDIRAIKLLLVSLLRGDRYGLYTLAFSIYMDKYMFQIFSYANYFVLK